MDKETPCEKKKKRKTKIAMRKEEMKESNLSYLYHILYNSYDSEHLDRGFCVKCVDTNVICTEAV